MSDVIFNVQVKHMFQKGLFQLALGCTRNLHGRKVKWTLHHQYHYCYWKSLCLSTSTSLQYVFHYLHSTWAGVFVCWLIGCLENLLTYAFIREILCSDCTMFLYAIIYIVTLKQLTMYQLLFTAKILYTVRHVVLSTAAIQLVQHILQRFYCILQCQCIRCFKKVSVVLSIVGSLISDLVDLWVYVVVITSYDNSSFCLWKILLHIVKFCMKKVDIQKSNRNVF